MPFLWLLACLFDAPPPPDVLVVTLDTTRADALGAYGRTPSPTPNIDAFAERSLRFDEALTVTPLTLPAHGSIWTGRYPDRTGLRDNQGGALPEDIETLATRVRQAGWHTGAFVSAAVLDEAMGLGAGFAIYDDTVVGASDPDVLIAERVAADTVDSALAWWAGLDAQTPRLTWVHLYDAHHPWQAPAPYSEQFDPYLAEVAYLDAQLGRLLQARRERPTWVVIAGDHGEGLGEHGERFHGVFLYRSTMRVPLLLQGPGVTPGVEAVPVSLVDIAPTLLGGLGLAPLAQTDGRSLLDPDPQRALYGESLHGRYQYGMAELRVWQDRELRYIDGPTPELFDWQADPDEEDNLWPVSPRTELRDGLTRFVAAREPVSAPGSDADVQALAALGYVSGPPLSVETPLDPLEHRDMVARVEALIVSARTRPPGEAVPLLRAFVDEYPGVGVAWVLLARALQLSAQPAEAVPVLEHLLESRPDDPQLLCMLGQALMDLQRYRPAQDALDEARRLRPQDPMPLGLLAELARREGRCAEASALASEALVHEPDDERLALIVAVCASDAEGLQARRSFALSRYDAGDHAEARTHLAPLEPVLVEAGDAYGLAVLADVVLRLDGAGAEVVRLLDLAEQADPEEVHVHVTRAHYLTETGDIPAAIASQQRARELVSE